MVEMGENIPFESLVPALNAFESVGDGLLLLDESGNCLWISPVAKCLLFGSRCSNAPGSLECLFGEGAHQIRLLTRRAAGNPAEFSTIEVAVSGIAEERWLEVRVLPALPEVRGVLLHLRDCTARKQLENRNNTSVARFESLISHLPAGFIVGDANRSVVNVNDELCRMFDLKFNSSDVLGKDCLEITRQAAHQFDDPAAFVRDVETIIRDKVPIRGAQIETADRRIFKFDYIPIFDPRKGTYRGHLWLFHDVTAMTQTTRALQESEERFRAISDASPLGIFVEDLNGYCIYVNPAYERIVGYPAEAMMGEGWRQRIHIEDRRSLRKQWEEAQLRLRDVPHFVFSFQHRSILPTGEVRWCIERIAAMHDDEGNISGYVGTIEDITDQLEHERAIRESEERYRALVEATSDAIFRADADGRPLEVKRPISDIDPAALPQTFMEIVHPDDHIHIHEAMKQYMVSGGHFEQEVRLRAKNGGWRHVSIRAVPLLDDSGTVREWVGATKDITVQKRDEAHQERLMQEAFRRANRDSLTGVLNHRAFHEHLLSYGAFDVGHAKGAHNGPNCCAVVAMDLDNFKYFNDVYGHLVGDDVLVRVTDKIREIASENAVVGRLGGDEFAVLLLPQPLPQLTETIEALRNSLHGMTYLPPGHSHAVPLRISVGSAIFPTEAQNLVDALAIADQRAIEDKRADRFLQAMQITEELRKTVTGFDMLDGLITAVDNKDRYTRRHSEEVLLYCLSMAETLQLDGEAVANLQVAALVHDVGKIGVPDYILRMPGRLEAEERRLMRRHIDTGILLMKAVPGMEAVTEIISNHQEAWDGSGYPHRKRGVEIPFLSRILSVADAFSAMTTDRPYRKGRTSDEALKELRRGAGKQWDPEMVEVLAVSLQQPLYRADAA
ncbi:MAG: hypothetical protein OHK0029_34930 [Armatimonadaceae bacterium]